MKVKSNERTVLEVLAGHFLRVPRFQRPFEWTKAEVEDFWDDVADAGKDYFIGSIVVFPSTHGTHGIVDGQQRITTITLLLCALRDALRTAGATNEADGLQNLVERRDVLDNQSHFVLQTDEDIPYLRHVQSGQAGDPPAPTAVERNLRAAHSSLTTRVRALLQEAGPQGQRQLLELRDKVLGLSLIHVEVDNEDDATVIFQTLNNRGRDLESADLVKSHLLSLLKTKNPAHDPARQAWNGILRSFEESEADLPMDRFLLHSWLSRREYLARADLGKKVRKTARRKADATSFLDELVTDAGLYRQIHEPDYRSRWQQEELPLREAFEALQLFRVRQPLPWVLALWREYHATPRGLRLRHVLPAIQAVERFHFISTAVTNQPSSGGGVQDVRQRGAAAARRRRPRSEAGRRRRATAQGRRPVPRAHARGVQRRVRRGPFLAHLHPAEGSRPLRPARTSRALRSLPGRPEAADGRAPRSAGRLHGRVRVRRCPPREPAAPAADVERAARRQAVRCQARAAAGGGRTGGPCRPSHPAGRGVGRAADHRAHQEPRRGGLQPRVDLEVGQASASSHSGPERPRRD